MREQVEGGEHGRRLTGAGCHQQQDFHMNSVLAALGRAVTGGNPDYRLTV
ncbi:hypothetical protein ACFQ1L_06390 [Phytohabitans flavus]